MHKEVKESLNRIFEKEGIHDGMVRAKKAEKVTKRMWKPAVAGIGVVFIALFLLLSPLTKESIDSTNGNPENDYESLNLFKLKGTYIGDNSALSEIVSTVVGEQGYEYIELQTKNEPYGLIVHTTPATIEQLQLKLALYVFALVQNADYVQFEMNGQHEVIQKSDLEKEYQIDFKSIQDEETLNSIYAELTESNDYPVVFNTTQEHVYKILFNARARAIKQPGIIDIFNPQFEFDLDGEKYYLWINDQSAVLVKVSDSHSWYKLSNEDFAELQKMLSEEILVITGEIIEIKGNRLYVEETDAIQNNGQYDSAYVSVENGDVFSVGQPISVWSSFVNESAPVQTTASRTQKK
ncbi:hypothetical protein CD30_06790 [Ureibacillus massiliensis 4400831 = CIP 108448 = CCUG 49529]|uniref:Uncharacterized protein n=1 Tax=Ureibacillus massiliensis 4400831 = CIP 108448 = CCUG 49529 TaxID=1211035 RepID=A0A0A3J2U9_9BACL|nr:DUF4825 domain-containing protein [Ureibacillus massiliensis]KGR91324.1 hypothetical protein CD30_06790 [Ureibacillus massiliensis 4400831 = CIP 108448 = CCUG 49529]